MTSRNLTGALQLKSRMITLFAILLGCVSCESCSGKKDASMTTTPIHEQDSVKKAVASGSFEKIDTLEGSGPVASAGQNISVHYTGMLTDGKVFDSSVNRGPFEFSLGTGQVIKGWDQGFDGMKVGGKRILVIPAEMGYGERGAGDAIPPGATLIFDVELLGVSN